MTAVNAYQKIWWDQVLSDHSVLVLLRREDAHPCHQLHYLQMVTEKLGKAYFWKDRAPGKGHASFKQFLQALNNRQGSKNRPALEERLRIARLFGFRSPDAFESSIKSSIPLAREIEQLAPALAGDDGPNPEYPWPRMQPVHAPASFEFPIWDRLNGSGKGHQLLKMIDRAVLKFPEYA